VHQQQQWIYHNSRIHFKVKDRLTISKHHDIINHVESYALTDPDTLLPRHRFLDEADFDELASGPTSPRLLWLADMDTSIAASSLARLGTLTPQASTYFLQTRTTRFYSDRAPRVCGAASIPDSPVPDGMVAVLMREMPG
jgi:hypothetical protein